MRTYKDFEKKYIGTSDIATLILVGCRGHEGLATDMLNFGGDDSYMAYIVEGADVEIGLHYERVASFTSWMKIYDDDELVNIFRADEINVYRAGYKGCIIQLIK